MLLTVCLQLWHDGHVSRCHLLCVCGVLLTVCLQLCSKHCYVDMTAYCVFAVCCLLCVCSCGMMATLRVAAYCVFAACCLLCVCSCVACVATNHVRTVCVKEESRAGLLSNLAWPPAAFASRKLKEGFCGMRGCIHFNLRNGLPRNWMTMTLWFLTRWYIFFTRWATKPRPAIWNFPTRLKMALLQQLSKVHHGRRVE